MSYIKEEVIYLMHGIIGEPTTRWFAQRMRTAALKMTVLRRNLYLLYIL